MKKMAETCSAVMNHIYTGKFVNSKKEIKVLLGAPKSYLFDLPYFSLRLNNIHHVFLTLGSSHYHKKSEKSC